MIAGAVRLWGVRCHRSLRVELGPRVTVLVGENGAGKTSVLEAVHLALQGTTPRTTQTRESITWGEDTLRVEVDVTDPDGRTTTVAFGYSDSGERRMTVDGSPLSDPARWEEELPVRMFLPDDVRLVKGSPSRRRRFLDRLAATVEPGYAAHLASYEQALDQRNALLRRGVVGDDHSPWESLLARTGLAVVHGRARTLQGVSGPYGACHRELAPGESDGAGSSGGATTPDGAGSSDGATTPDGAGEPGGRPRTGREGRPGLVYRTNAAGLDEEAYRERLTEQRAADRRRTFTNLGPHRDDVRFLLGGRDLRQYGSQGEQRTALLALLLAERSWMTERTGRPPLLLLDDVMSELDDRRRRSLVEVVSRVGQAVITTTDLHYFTSEELATMVVVELGG